LKTTIALLTCERLPELNPADRALIPLFAVQDIVAVPVVWNAPDVRWQDFSALIVRTTWDYYKEAEAFRRWLDAMEQIGVPVFNPVSVVRDNMHKFYLKRFQEKGITIIPTLFSAASAPLAFDELQTQGWEKVVIKPAISAGSFLTDSYELSALKRDRFQEIVSQGDWLIQPYLPEIATAGELSMIFFNGKFSHAVLKKPKAGDFRVQKQYGGQYQRVDPSPELLQLGQRIATLENDLLYARVDGVIIDNQFHLMELELIEPDLYFEFGDDISKRFVESVMEKISKTNVHSLRSTVHGKMQ
jgi:glutathione synthase/RimK-type ligase-like ATP-grasp enzyme